MDGRSSGEEDGCDDEAYVQRMALGWPEVVDEGRVEAAVSSDGTDDLGNEVAVDAGVDVAQLNWASDDGDPDDDADDSPRRSDWIDLQD